MERWRNQGAGWRQKNASAVQRRAAFKTPSQVPVQEVYTPEDIPEMDYLRDIGLPGEYPYLRGIHPTGYRGRLWTMRMFAGFGLAEETNERFKLLMNNGQTGLSVAFDMPTLYGLDTDDPRGAGEFGTCGVAISSLADMETLFQGIALDQVTTSMTINSPAAIIWAMFIAVAEKQGADLRNVGGTLQNDILKEYIAQNEYIFPPGPSMRLVVDTVEFATHHMPKWNPISISGYHIREAGANAVQELAFTLADGFEYVRHCLDRGLDIDEFVPRLSFFFNVHNNFFEEIAKFRAARRIWAREMTETYKAKNPRSAWFAVPRPDFGRDADRAAAGEQCGPGVAAGIGRRVGGMPVVAHKRQGRGMGSPIGGDPRYRRSAPSRSSPMKLELPTRWTRWAVASSWNR